MTTNSSDENPMTTSSQPKNKAAPTKTQKNNRRLIKLLEERYPKTFNWNNPQPLKIGIDKEIQTDELLTSNKLKRALAAYTHSNRYKKCLQTISHRVDLEGQIETTSPITKTKKAPPAAKLKTKNITPKQKAKTQKKDALENYSPEERMKIKLEQLVAGKK